MKQWPSRSEAACCIRPQSTDHCPLTFSDEAVEWSIPQPLAEAAASAGGDFPLLRFWVRQPARLETRHAATPAVTDLTG